MWLGHKLLDTSFTGVKNNVKLQSAVKFKDDGKPYNGLGFPSPTPVSLKMGQGLLESGNLAYS
jgi:hypothetical protein